MPREEIDEYLAALDEPQRTTLGELRDTIAGILPDAEQCISYGMPAFRLRGKVIAGFAAFKHHLSYLPHSGSVLSELRDELSTFSQSKGALRFPVSQPLHRELVERLIAVRLRQAFGAPAPDTPRD
ncbi:MAG: iron chaperone [Candidatus Dormibacteria bacterium]